MLSQAAQQCSPTIVTVQEGWRTSFYFIEITGEGTRFRDIWVHLKRVVKRLEHVEIYPGCKGGWICVYKHATLLKTLETLQQAVYVESTSTSEFVNVSVKNVSEPVQIRLPRHMSRYVAKIIGHVMQRGSRPAGLAIRVREPRPRELGPGEPKNWARRPREPRPREEPREVQTAIMPVIAHGTYIPGVGFGGNQPNTPSRGQGITWPGNPQQQLTPHENHIPMAGTQTACMPVIANGTYDPSSMAHGAYIPYCPHPYHPQAWGGFYMTPEWTCWDASSPFDYGTQVVGPPALNAVHTVELSGFHHNTTMREVEGLVTRAAKFLRLRKEDYSFSEGVRVVTKSKSDARKLAKCLDGWRLNGATLTATRKKTLQEC
ncbi:hypothetical protein F5Y10DRAFT_271022 [Nemania abortiva]|nr:hypothetical protein F5Y10DRAFT_271022 [Nemania abortiva]